MEWQRRQDLFDYFFMKVISFFLDKGSKDILATLTNKSGKQNAEVVPGLQEKKKNSRLSTIGSSQILGFPDKS